MAGLIGSARLEAVILRRSPVDVLFLITVPLQTMGVIAVLRYAGRPDLEFTAVLAPALMALWQNALFVCGELVTKDRDNQRLELLVSSPMSFYGYLCGRVGAVTAFSLVVFAEAIAFGWLAFGVAPSFSQLGPAAVTLVVTALATVATSILLSIVFVNTRNPHTYQNALGYPMFILGGVLVPVSIYPEWLEIASRFVYLSWASDLFRDTLGAGTAEDWAPRCAVILGLGLVTALLGGVLVRRTLRHARQEGRLALT
ncbi:hypothetical protein ASF78_10540 [Cellulomonas sp. Leaf334]|nr:hypothetical protein ASF78_10540 [Cellulomonas sp. Leaf334]